MMPSLEELGDLPTHDQEDAAGQAPTVTPDGENPTAAHNESQPGTTVESEDAPKLSEGDNTPPAPQPSADEVLDQTSDPAAAGKGRSEALAKSRTGKMDQLFTGRNFKVLQKIELGKDQYFTTPLGNKGRTGYLVEDVASSERFPVGVTTLKLMNEKYGAVQNMPDLSKPKKAAAAPPTPEEPAQDSEDSASPE